MEIKTHSIYEELWISSYKLDKSSVSDWPDSKLSLVVPAYYIET